jgi:hypothetical protein
MDLFGQILSQKVGRFEPSGNAPGAIRIFPIIYALFAFLTPRNLHM